MGYALSSYYITLGSFLSPFTGEDFLNKRLGVMLDDFVDTMNLTQVF